MNVIRGLLLVGCFILNAAAAQRFGGDAAVLVSLVTIMCAWGIGLWDASAEQEKDVLATVRRGTDA